MTPSGLRRTAAAPRRRHAAVRSRRGHGGITARSRSARSGPRCAGPPGSGLHGSARSIWEGPGSNPASPGNRSDRSRVSCLAF